MSKLVYCSGELYEDPITTDECLECALKHVGSQPCGFGYRLLKALNSRDPPNPEPGFLCSYCPHITCSYNKTNGG